MARTYVFDAYGTLFDVLSVRALCDRFWSRRGEALSRLWREKQLEYSWLRSQMQRYAPFSQVTQDALAYACEALGLDLDAPRVEALMAEYRRLAAYPDVAPTLARLQGSRCAILTNGSPDMIDPLVAQSGLAFDAVLSVDALQVYKPSPRVYALATERLDTPAGDIVFVSSNCWDALGAKAFGFRVYWINRGGAPVDRLGFAPDGVLRTLGELPGA